MLPLLSGPGKLKKYICIIGNEELDIKGFCAKLYKIAICPRREYGHDTDILTHCGPVFFSSIFIINHSFKVKSLFLKIQPGGPN
jgi:hypothetical protein